MGWIPLGMLFCTAGISTGTNFFLLGCSRCSDAGTDQGVCRINFIFNCSINRDRVFLLCQILLPQPCGQKLSKAGSLARARNLSLLRDPRGSYPPPFPPHLCGSRVLFPLFCERTQIEKVLGHAESLQTICPHSVPDNSDRFANILRGQPSQSKRWRLFMRPRQRRAEPFGFIRRVPCVDGGRADVRASQAQLRESSMHRHIQVVWSDAPLVLAKRQSQDGKSHLS